MPQDFYETLGVSKSSSPDEIKRAYRKLAQKHHPDRTKGDKTSETKFKEINSAYEILSDPQKRTSYDQFGSGAFSGGAGGGSGGFDTENFGGFGEGFADIFETFFNGGSGGRSPGRKSQSMRGNDLETATKVSFEEAAFGVEKVMNIRRIAECVICHGQGSAPGSKMVKCSICGGSGEVRSVRSTILGQMSSRHVCETCSGAGSVAENKCRTCEGAGRVRVVENIRIKIPAGISDGATMRINAKGDAGVHGGGGGDLYVHIQIEPHRVFSRKNESVYSEHKIHLVEAVLGSTVKIPTIHGEVSLRIPAGTQDGKQFKLKSYGVAKLKSEGKGDHFVTIHVAIPEKLSKPERELYQNLAKEGGIEISEEKGFFKKIMGE